MQGYFFYHKRSGNSSYFPYSSRFLCQSCRVPPMRQQPRISYLPWPTCGINDAERGSGRLRPFECALAAKIYIPRTRCCCQRHSSSRHQIRVVQISKWGSVTLESSSLPPCMLKIALLPKLLTSLFFNFSKNSVARLFARMPLLNPESFSQIGSATLKSISFQQRDLLPPWNPYRSLRL